MSLAMLGVMSPYFNGDVYGFGFLRIFIFRTISPLYIVKPLSRKIEGLFVFHQDLRLSENGGVSPL